MANSVVAICNQALGELGQEPIVSLSDNTRRAKACNRAYETIRDEVLSEHQWNEAIKRATLAQLAGEPEFEYPYHFQLPSDFIRAVLLNESSDRWAIEGRAILSYDSEVELVYVHRLEDVAKMSDQLKKCISYKLAMRISLPLTGSQDIKDAVYKLYMNALAEAKFADSQQAPTQQVGGTSWIAARYTGGNSDEPVYRRIAST